MPRSRDAAPEEVTPPRIRRITPEAIAPADRSVPRPTVVPYGRDLDGAFCPLQMRSTRMRTFEDTFRYELLPGGDINVYTMHDGRPYVCIRDSSLQGANKGVFACVDFHADDETGQYCGAILGRPGCKAGEESKSDCLIDHVAFTYVSDPDRHWLCVVDGRLPVQDASEQRRVLGLSDKHPVPFGEGAWPGAFMHLMNDAKGPRNNCAVYANGLTKALRFIPGCSPDAPPNPESEMMWSYGDIFWEKDRS